MILPVFIGLDREFAIGVPVIQRMFKKKKLIDIGLCMDFKGCWKLFMDGILRTLDS
jgi:hypothetical protein